MQRVFLFCLIIMGLAAAGFLTADHTAAAGNKAGIETESASQESDLELSEAEEEGEEPAENENEYPPVEESIRSMAGQKYYLSCNLHSDPVFKKVSSVNYQLRGGLIPWGTPVEVTRVHRNKLLFKNLETGRSYAYEFHRKTRRATTLAKHLGQVFIKDVSSVKRKVAGLSEKDKDGIYAGRVMPGMSREGVIIAIGYPPEFANPAPMKAREWHYWRDRWSRMVVAFNRKGVVSEIVGNY